MRLSDCFIEIMGYVSGLFKSDAMKQPAYEDVRDQLRRLVDQSERLVEQGALTREDFDLGFFAICAWVDETILSSVWIHKNRWLNDQLQRRHYNTTDAGVQFYQHLEKLQPHQNEVREVYYLCLALGFVGRYCQPGDDYLLEQIKASNLRALLGPTFQPPQPDTALFPGAYPGTDSPVSVATAQKSSRLVTAVCLAAPVLLFCILYLVYRFTLSGVSDNFLRTVAS